MSEPETPDAEQWPPPEFHEILDAGLARSRIDELLEIRRAQYPDAIPAILADARSFAMFRNEPIQDPSDWAALGAAVRLCWTSDAFLSLVSYRLRCTLARLHVPVLPGLLHKFSMAIAQLNIGDPVVIEPGVYIPHGQVVVDGFVHVGKQVVIAPWVGIGLEIGHLVGAKVAEGVYFATGSKVIGPVRIGPFSQVAANSVVIHDVPERTIVAGSPARVVGASRIKVSFPRREDS